MINVRKLRIFTIRLLFDTTQHLNYVKFPRS